MDDDKLAPSTTGKEVGGKDEAGPEPRTPKSNRPATTGTGSTRPDRRCKNAAGKGGEMGEGGKRAEPVKELTSQEKKQLRAHEYDDVCKYDYSLHLLENEDLSVETHHHTPFTLPLA